MKLLTMTTCKTWMLTGLISAATIGCGSADQDAPKPEAGDAIADDESKAPSVDVDSEQDAALKAKKKVPAKTPPQTLPQALANDPLTITSLNYSGSACAPGSVATNLSPDAQAFTFVFSNFTVSANAGKKAVTAQKNCTLKLGMSMPKGWQMALLTLDYRGFASLPAGASTQVSTDVKFGGRAVGRPFNSVIKGPKSEDFQFRQQANLAAGSWSPCGGRIDLRLAVTAKMTVKPNSSALFAIDSADGELHHRYGLAWRKCR